jgi:hypothetical protein
MGPLNVQSGAAGGSSNFESGSRMGAVVAGFRTTRAVLMCGGVELRTLVSRTAVSAAQPASDNAHTAAPIEFTRKLADKRAGHLPNIGLGSFAQAQSLQRNFITHQNYATHN